MMSIHVPGSGMIEMLPVPIESWRLFQVPKNAGFEFVELLVSWTVQFPFGDSPK